MGIQTSQDYSVDNRYGGVKSAADNTAGKQFLDSFLREEKSVGVRSAGTLQARDLTQQRSQDNHFLLGGMGGTIPVGALGLGQQISNTDTAYRFKNAFGSMQSPVERRTARVT
jgi:hypothetical protein